MNNLLPSLVDKVYIWLVEGERRSLRGRKVNLVREGGGKCEKAWIEWLDLIDWILELADKVRGCVCGDSLSLTSSSLHFSHLLQSANSRFKSISDFSASSFGWPCCMITPSSHFRVLFCCESHRRGFVLKERERTDCRNWLNEDRNEGESLGSNADAVILN